MSTDELSTTESRIARGCDHLLTSAANWFTAADVEERATRTAIGRAFGSGIATWFIGGLAYNLGPIAWSAAGGLLALAVWVAGALASTDDEDQDETGEGDEGFDLDAFRELVCDVAGGANVHLTAIRQQLQEETGQDWDVLDLCRAAGITTKPVRVPGADPAVTTGIHRTDLPPLPQPLSAAPVGVVAAGHNPNNNSNNGGEPLPEAVVLVPDMLRKASQ